MSIKNQILDIAARLIQQRGFNGFSYADIAVEIGIRKASLHHHFPSKTGLGIALIARYDGQFRAALEDIDAKHSGYFARLRAFIGLYRESLVANKMCLCGMLATDHMTLDAALLPSLQNFFKGNAAWLQRTLRAGVASKEFRLHGTTAAVAQHWLASLQGALLVAYVTGEPAGFEMTEAQLRQSLIRE